MQLVENKNGILSDKENHRPISLASVITNIFEKYCLHGVKNYFGLQITSLVFKKVILLT